MIECSYCGKRFHIYMDLHKHLVCPEAARVVYQRELGEAKRITALARDWQRRAREILVRHDNIELLGESHTTQLIGDELMALRAFIKEIRDTDLENK